MITGTLRALATTAALLVLAACATQPAAPSAAAADGPPKSILWVGNSFFYYNNGMHGQLGQLASADKTVSVRSTSVTIGGSGIDWHDVGAYLAPGRLGGYSFVGDNEVRFNPPGRQYDAVMMMDCSQCPIHPQLKPVFHDYAGRHARTIRAAGARPILFMSWAYKDKPEMTAQLAEQYTLAGKAIGAQVVPAGLAFAKSVAKRPQLELYVADKRHPSLAGTYLAACTVFATVLWKSPVGNTYTAGLPADVAAHLQQVAWETAREYAGR